ncbi:MAG: PIG-L family deacetylase [Candidatus Omnitrophota bacterium]|nr:PIG-L family deacetylase [Candidatus Omnitrophota bacterium]MBU1929313.1 PIG-L family deacetylase [Candidatus Omnitrophota bacterium]MBU2035605.1 PIG-L family deacetylase [Candidatus Omnitrophota bacterium]MBU2221603.1 PIG-L family deacetylase [Candidatus Omnitrophota bacterium]MBU2258536.1 PIG-L family deacetylase [Candidatus Omnitrophota bacterium]
MLHISRLINLCIFFYTLLFLRTGFADSIWPIPSFTQDDRVIVFAPHPDDESIGTAGVIQEALSKGAKVKVVCFTNGDNNELAFIVYEKRLTFKKNEFLHMGRVRSRETIGAMASLGLKREDIIFLGYPDWGTMEILTKYWGDTKPFKSMLTRVDKVSYEDALSVGAPYTGESIVKDIKNIILDFKPNKIFVSHPGDANRDHQALYLFLRIVLWDLNSHNLHVNPQVFPYIIHVVGWPKPRGFHPEMELVPPPKLEDAPWQDYSLTPQEIENKHKAISSYQSQIEYNPPYLFTFCRKKELFGDYPDLLLKNEDTPEIKWKELISDDYLQDVEEYALPPSRANKSPITAVYYALKSRELIIKFKLRRKVDRGRGISIFLLGYSRNTDFKLMPKLKITLGILGTRVKDKKQTIFIKNLRVFYEGRNLIVRVPLASLDNPDYILSRIKARNRTLPYHASSWRVIELAK